RPQRGSDHVALRMVADDRDPEEERVRRDGADRDDGAEHGEPRGNGHGRICATRMRARGAASGVTTALRRSRRTESYFQSPCPDGARTGSRLTSSSSLISLTTQ